MPIHVGSRHIGRLDPCQFLLSPVRSIRVLTTRTTLQGCSPPSDLWTPGEGFPRALTISGWDCCETEAQARQGVGNPVDISHFTADAHKSAAVGLLPRPHRAGAGFRGSEDLLAPRLCERQGDVPPMMLRPRTPNLEVPSVHLLLPARDICCSSSKRERIRKSVYVSPEMAKDRGLDSCPINHGAPRFQLVGLTPLPCNIKQQQSIHWNGSSWGNLIRASARAPLPTPLC